MVDDQEISCVQGGSFSYDISSPSLPTLDANWVGSWALVEKLGDPTTTLASGSMVLSQDSTCLELRVTPSDTLALDPGNYFLVGEIENTTINFNREVVRASFEVLRRSIA